MAAVAAMMIPTVSSMTGSAMALIRRQSLDDAIASQHTSIHREVAAHHEGAHSRVLLRQSVALVREVRLVFAPIDEHEAGEARRAPVRLVQGIPPAAAPAQTCAACQ